MNVKLKPNHSWVPGYRNKRLVAVGPVFSTSMTHGGRENWVVCVCDCGNYVVARPRSSGGSCGCWKRESASAAMAGYHASNPVRKKGSDVHSFKHGLSQTKLYKTWRGMLVRTGGKKDKHKYLDVYRSRGISLCNEWKTDFLAFRDWALSNGYKEGLTIDRIDPEGHYEPSNCRWITRSENSKWVTGAWRERAFNAESERDLLAASVMFLLQELAA